MDLPVYDNLKDFTQNSIYDYLEWNSGGNKSMCEYYEFALDKYFNIAKEYNVVKRKRSIYELQKIQNVLEICHYIGVKVVEMQSVIDVSSINTTQDDSEYRELSPKEKLILLDKLGIIDCLTAQLVEPDNASHLADIIQRFTGMKISKASLKGYCNYLIRRSYSPNSPYGSEDAVEKVNRIYNDFRLKDKTN